MGGARRRPPPTGDAVVDALEPLGDAGRSPRVGRVRAHSAAERRAERVVLGEPRHRGRRELGLVGEPGGLGDRAAARLAPRAAAARCRPARARRSPPRPGRPAAPRASRASARPRTVRGRAAGSSAAASAAPCGRARPPSRAARAAAAARRGRRRSGRARARRRSAAASPPGRTRSCRRRAGSPRSRRGSARRRASIALSDVPSSASTRARSFARWFLRGGTAIRSVEKNVAAVVVSASSSAAEDRLGRPGSKPCTTSKRAERERGGQVRADAHRQRRPARSARSARPRRSRRRLAERRRAAARGGPPAGRRRARRARRSVTAWPRRRSASALPRTCSLTSSGCDHENGVTKQMRRPIGGSDSSPAADRR